LVADGFDDISRTRFTFGSDHSGAFGHASKSFTKIASATNERNLESMLVDMILVVCRCQDFGLIDIINSNGLENLTK
jgi:hypothetical protein